MAKHDIEAWQQVPTSISAYALEEEAKLVFSQPNQDRPVFIVNLDQASCEELMSVLNEVLPAPRRWTAPKEE